MKDEIEGVGTAIEDLSEQVTRGLERVANAITPLDACPSPGVNGNGQVGSLTEAIMDHAHAMMRVANALESIADAIRESKS